jgi:hypothetical protein
MSDARSSPAKAGAQTSTEAGPRPSPGNELRKDWTRDEVAELFLSAGSESMSESAQMLCFLAGANGIFTGDKLLTTGNAGADADTALFDKLGLRAMTSGEPARVAAG